MRRVQQRASIQEGLVPLMGVCGAFVFAAQMVNFAIPGTGSSGHITGGILLSILLGSHGAFVVMASILTVQSLFFADGGLLALGCNIWNLAFYPAFVAYPLVFRPLARSADSRRLLVASLASVVVALELGALSITLQTLLSGRTELPFLTFAGLMLPIHLAIAIGEGLVTAGLIGYVRRVRPEVLRMEADRRPMRAFFVGTVVAAVVAAGVLSWFASPKPDGLEWSIIGTYGSVELPRDGLVSTLERWQERLSPLPGYDLPGGDRKGWPAVSKGRFISGVVGSLTVLVAILALGLSLRSLRRRRDVRRVYRSQDH